MRYAAMLHNSEKLLQSVEKSLKDNQNWEFIVIDSLNDICDNDDDRKIVYFDLQINEAK